MTNKSLLQLIKQASKEEREASCPCDVIIGTIVTTSPLKVRIAGKILLDYDFLIYGINSPMDSLHKNQKMVLLRVSGGQKYYILDVLEW